MNAWLRSILLWLLTILVVSACWGLAGACFGYAGEHGVGHELAPNVSPGPMAEAVAGVGVALLLGGIALGVVFASLAIASVLPEKKEPTQEAPPP